MWMPHEEFEILPLMQHEAFDTLTLSTIATMESSALIKIGLIPTLVASSLTFGSSLLLSWLSLCSVFIDSSVISWLHYPPHLTFDSYQHLIHHFYRIHSLNHAPKYKIIPQKDPAANQSYGQIIVSAAKAKNIIVSPMIATPIFTCSDLSSASLQQ